MQYLDLTEAAPFARVLPRPLAPAPRLCTLLATGRAAAVTKRDVAEFARVLVAVLTEANSGCSVATAGSSGSGGGASAPARLLSGPLSLVDARALAAAGDRALGLMRAAREQLAVLAYSALLAPSVGAGAGSGAGAGAASVSDNSYNSNGDSSDSNGANVGMYALPWPHRPSCHRAHAHGHGSGGGGGANASHGHGLYRQYMHQTQALATRNNSRAQTAAVAQSFAEPDPEPEPEAMVDSVEPQDLAHLPAVLAPLVSSLQLQPHPSQLQQPPPQQQSQQSAAGSPAAGPAAAPASVSASAALNAAVPAVVVLPSMSHGASVTQHSLARRWPLPPAHCNHDNNGGGSSSASGRSASAGGTVAVSGADIAHGASVLTLLDPLLSLGAACAAYSPADALWLAARAAELWGLEQEHCQQQSLVGAVSGDDGSALVCGLDDLLPPRTVTADCSAAAVSVAVHSNVARHCASNSNTTAATAAVGSTAPGAAVFAASAAVASVAASVAAAAAAERAIISAVSFAVALECARDARALPLPSQSPSTQLQAQRWRSQAHGLLPGGAAVAQWLENHDTAPGAAPLVARLLAATPRAEGWWQHTVGPNDDDADASAFIAHVGSSAQSPQPHESQSQPPQPPPPPQPALDSRRVRVVCPAPLGNPFGSTSPLAPALPLALAAALGSTYAHTHPHAHSHAHSHSGNITAASSVADSERALLSAPDCTGSVGAGAVSGFAGRFGFGGGFPVVTPADQALAHALLLAHLGLATDSADAAAVAQTRTSLALPLCDAAAGGDGNGAVITATHASSASAAATAAAVTAAAGGTTGELPPVEALSLLPDTMPTGLPPPPMIWRASEPNAEGDADADSERSTPRAGDHGQGWLELGVPQSAGGRHGAGNHGAPGRVPASRAPTHSRTHWGPDGSRWALVPVPHAAASAGASASATATATASGRAQWRSVRPLLPPVAPASPFGLALALALAPATPPAVPSVQAADNSNCSGSVSGSGIGSGTANADAAASAPCESATANATATAAETAPASASMPVPIVLPCGGLRGAWRYPRPPAPLLQQFLAVRALPPRYAAEAAAALGQSADGSDDNAGTVPPKLLADAFTRGITSAASASVAVSARAATDSAAAAAAVAARAGERARLLLSLAPPPAATALALRPWLLDELARPRGGSAKLRPEAETEAEAAAEAEARYWSRLLTLEADEGAVAATAADWLSRVRAASRRKASSSASSSGSSSNGSNGSGRSIPEWERAYGRLSARVPAHLLSGLVPTRLLTRAHAHTDADADAADAIACRGGLWGLVGASMGGMQALSLAALVPGLFPRAAVICTTGKTSPATAALRFVQRTALRQALAQGGSPATALDAARLVGTLAYRTRYDLTALLNSCISLLTCLIVFYC